MGGLTLYFCLSNLFRAHSEGMHSSRCLVIFVTLFYQQETDQKRFSMHTVYNGFKFLLQLSPVSVSSLTNLIPTPTYCNIHLIRLLILFLLVFLCMRFFDERGEFFHVEEITCHRIAGSESSGSWYKSTLYLHCGHDGHGLRNCSDLTSFNTVWTCRWRLALA